MNNLLIMSAYVAGVGHSNPDLSAIQPKAPLRLVPEPQNQYDPEAILVFNGSEKLGYVPREQTIVLHQAAAHGLKLSAFAAEVQAVRFKEINFHVFAGLPEGLAALSDTSEDMRSLQG